MKCLTLLLLNCCLLTASVRATEFAPTVAASPKSVAWRTSMLDAFVEAIENEKRLVVLFALDPSQPTIDGRRVSIEQRLEFDRPELAALADSAVFVVCYYDSTTGRMHDEFAERVRAHFKITTLPTVSTIFNRTDTLAEAGRFEGFFGAAELAKGLMEDLQRPMTTSVEQGQSGAVAPPSAAPGTPSEAVRCYEEALTSGDAHALSEMFAEPYGTGYASMVSSVGELSMAKQRFRSALDQQFGHASAPLDFGHDLEAMRRNLEYVTEVAFLSLKSMTEDRAIVEVRITQTDVAPFVADLELAREGNVWRMLPSNRHEVDLLAYYQSTSSESRLYAIQLDQIAEQVLRGTFSNREQALQAVTAACSRDDNGSHAAGYE
jgi:hypothetical protein